MPSEDEIRSAIWAPGGDEILTELLILGGEGVVCSLTETVPVDLDGTSSQEGSYPRL